MSSVGKWSWNLFKNLLFLADPERAHDLALASLAFWSRFCSADMPASDISRNPGLKRTFFGIDFPNPLGLAAGFDKNAMALPAWQALGFGFVEIGTVTARPQPGNPKPRLFRLIRDRALFNNLGFNNDGALQVARRIAAFRSRGRVKIPVGVNIGKSRNVPLAAAVSDYRESFSSVADVADYVVLNVSSPNTPGLRDLQEENRLGELLESIASENEMRRGPVPLLLKLAPDLSPEGAVSCARLSAEKKLAGLVISNTTVSREGIRRVPEGPGGISGMPLLERSTEMLRTLHREFGGKLAMIGVGGIMDVPTARAKLAAGASLLQTYTGFVYGGPGFPREILKGIV